jgi:hypothetical protein
MHGQESPRRIQQNIDCITRRPQKSRIGHGTSLRTFIYPRLLASSMLLVGFTTLTTLGQDLSKQQSQILSQQSGFLSNYAELQPDPKNPDLLIYWKNKDAFKTSTKLMIDPVVVYLLPEAQQRAIDPADLDKLAQTFTQAIKSELTNSGVYEVVTEPGPGILEVRIAITNVEPTGGTKNAAVKGAATAASVAFAPGASLLVPRVSVGKVSIEGEILDSASGQVQVDFMTSKTGRRYFSGLKQFQTWGDINAAFQSWAKNFCQRLKAYQT